MLILNHAAELQDEVAGCRRDFHKNPELLYDVHETAAKVTRLLEQFGVDEVVTGIGRTGVVGVITGKGGHAAMPHICIDPIVAATAVVQAIQLFVSRSVDPMKSVVVSITTFHAGYAFNVIPGEAQLGGTARCLDEDLRHLAEKRICEIVDHVSKAHGCTAEVDYDRQYPTTVNHDEQVRFTGEIARSPAGDANVDMNTPQVMGGEDFSFMLQARPGAFTYLGNGDSAGLHQPEYDFNDDAIPHGISFFAELARKAMPA